MKNLLLFLLPAFLAWHDPAPAQGIRFDNASFSDLLAKAKKEKKMLFIDCYTSWCGPCKWMEKNVFPNDTVSDFYNSHFVCASFDMEKGEGITIKNRYDVRCYPTYLFIDEKGNLVHRQSSACPVQQFIALGKAALSPETQFAAIEHACTVKNPAPADMLRYMAMRVATCLSVDSVLDVYVRTQADTSYSNRQNWTVLTTFVSSPENAMFQYLLTHQQEFSEKYTKDSVERVITHVYGSAMSKCLSGTHPDTTAYIKLRTEVVNLHLPFTDRIIIGYDLSFYSVTRNWSAYARTASLFIRNYADSNAAVLNNIAWEFYENVTDTVYLDTAISWAARSVALDPSYYNTDTYAALLYKRGRKQEAEIQAVRSIDFADKAGIDAAETKELLAKIRAMQ